MKDNKIEMILFTIGVMLMILGMFIDNVHAGCNGNGFMNGCGDTYNYTNYYNTYNSTYINIDVDIDIDNSTTINQTINNETNNYSTTNNYTTNNYTLDNAQAEANSTAIMNIAAKMDRAYQAEMNGIAANAAMVTVTPTAPGKTTFSANVGQYGDFSAVGISVMHRLTTKRPIYFNVGVAGNGQYLLGRAGVSIEF